MPSNAPWVFSADRSSLGTRARRFAWISMTTLAASVQAQQSPSMELDAARIELMALRTAARDTSPLDRDRYTLDGAPDLLSAPEAILALSGRAKPLNCRSQLWRNIVRIRCSRIVTSGRSEAGEDPVTRSKFLGNLPAPRRHIAITDPLLLVGRDTMIGTVGSVEQWSWDYAIGRGPSGVQTATGSPREGDPYFQSVIECGCVAIVKLSPDPAVEGEGGMRDMGAVPREP
jgi:hypothetical protein